MNRVSVGSPQQQSESAVPPIGIIALNRMGFGPRPGDLDSFNSLGSTDTERLSNYIDQQLDPESIDDSELQARIAAAGYKTLDKSLKQLWEDHFINHNGDPFTEILPYRETERFTFLRAVYSRRQLVEVMADFWHNHFNVYSGDYWVRSIFIHHDRDIIRKHMFGNFRDFLEAITRSTSMLVYLDNYTNSVTGPNENFARELLELHTMGAMNYLGVGSQHDVPLDSNGRPVGYVDDDIYEAARCFTGWTIRNYRADPVIGNTGEFLYRSDWHDRFQKTVLGDHIPHDQADLVDGRQVLDLLAYHPGTAKHIAYKLCKRLISDNPPDSIINSTAAVFYSKRESSTQLKQVLRHILNSVEFRSTWAEKTKRPFEVVASALRATETDFAFTVDDEGSTVFFWFFNMIGQSLFRRRTPDGYPDSQKDWINTLSIVMSWRLLNWLVTADDPHGNLRFDVLAQTPTNVRSAVDLVDYWITRILGRTISSEQRDHLIEYMAQGRNPDIDLPIDTETNVGRRLSSMVALILMSPEFQRR